MKIRLNLTVLFFGTVAILATLLLLFNVHASNAAITTDAPTVTTNTYRTYQFFASTTVPTTLATSTVGQATSTNINSFIDTSGRVDNGYMVIAGAKKVQLYFSRGGITHANTGNTVFTMQESPDGTNWYNISRLVNATSTTVTNAIETSIVTLGAATSTVPYSLDLSNDTFYAIRCIITNTTDGEAGCQAYATF